MIMSPRDAGLARRWLILLTLGAVIPSPAEAAGARDILYLNKYGDGASDVSWCNDRAFTFKTHGPSRPGSVFPPEYSRSTTVNVFTMETQQVRPVVVSDYDAFSADCVRDGEYVFLAGLAYTARAIWGGGDFQAPFYQFMLTRPPTGNYEAIAGDVRRDFGLEASLRTAPDGSVFALGSSSSSKLDDFGPPKQTSRKPLPNYRVTREGVTITYVNPNKGTTPPQAFPFYLFSSEDYEQGGVYDCSTGRPGCSAGGSEPRVGYYLFGTPNGEPKRRFLYTITPKQEPLVRRWPIVGRAPASGKLEITSAVLDEKRCYVLLEPIPWDPANKIGKRLKLDVYVAQCRFAANQLEYDEPRVVAQKQASFMFPSLSLNGDYLVVKDFRDFASQRDDQLEFEGDAIDRPNVCARLFRAGTWPLTHENTICIRQGRGDEGNGLEVSPQGGFVHIRSQANPLIVGREFRNDGSAPAWLNNGDAR